MTTPTSHMDIELAALFADSGSKMLLEAWAYLTEAGRLATPREIQAISQTMTFANGLIADAQTLLYSATIQGADEVEGVDNPSIQV